MDTNKIEVLFTKIVDTDIDKCYKALYIDNKKSASFEAIVTFSDNHITTSINNFMYMSPMAITITEAFKKEILKEGDL